MLNYVRKRKAKQGKQIYKEAQNTMDIPHSLCVAFFRMLSLALVHTFLILCVRSSDNSLFYFRRKPTCSSLCFLAVESGLYSFFFQQVEFMPHDFY